MATVTSLAFAEDTANDTSTTTNAAVTVAAGDMLVVLIACENSGASGAAPGITVDDSDGLNTYVERQIVNYDPGAAKDGATLGVFSCLVTDAVTTGTITATFDTNTDQKCIQVYRVRPATNEVLSYVTSSTGSTGSATTHSAPTVSVGNGDIIFGAASLESDNTMTGDSDTTNGSWSTIVERVATGASDDESMELGSQYKTVTATGNQSWACTTGANQASARTYIVIGVAKTLTASAGSYAITGASGANAVQLLRGRKLAVTDVGSYAITGTDATLSYTGAKQLNAEPGSYAITGTDASTLQAWKLDATTGGSYAFTGIDASTNHGWAVFPDAGSYLITGTDPTALKLTYRIFPEAGSYLFTGTDAGLNKTGTYSIVIGPGAYNITGTDATLAHGYKLAMDAGSYAITGTDLDALRRNLLIFYDTPGSYVFTGTDVTLTKTVSAHIPIVGTLEGATYSHALVIREPRGSLSVESHLHTLDVHTTIPTLAGVSHTHTLKVNR